jgi:hypothetical protein
MTQSAIFAKQHIHILYNMNRIKLFEKLERDIDFNAQNSTTASTSIKLSI